MDYTIINLVLVTIILNIHLSNLEACLDFAMRIVILIPILGMKYDDDLKGYY